MSTLTGPFTTYGNLLFVLNDHWRYFGLNVMSPGFTLNNLRFKAFMCLYIGYNLTTWLSLVQAMGNFMDTAFWFVPLGFVIQSIVKIYMAIANRKTLLKLLNEIHVIYQRTTHHPQQTAVLEKHVQLASTIFKIMRRFYRFVGILIVVTPLFLSIYTGKLTLIIDIAMPFVDHSTIIGFSFKYAIISYLVYLVMKGLTGSDSILVVIILCEIGHIKVIELMIKEFNEVLTEKENSSEEIERRIIEIIDCHVSHIG